jgi:hypothetical protein
MALLPDKPLNMLVSYFLVGATISTGWFDHGQKISVQASGLHPENEGLIRNTHFSDKGNQAWSKAG